MSRRDRISSFTRPSERYSRIKPRRTSNDESSVSREQQSHTTVSPSKGHVLPSRTLNSPNPIDKKQHKSKVLHRNGLNKLPKYKPIKKSKRKAILFTASAMSVIVMMSFLGGLTYWGVEHRHQIAAKVKAPTVKNYGTENSAVMGVQHNQSYIPDLPVMLYIDRMGLTADIKAVGGTDKEIKPTEDINNVGWFEGSSKPGSGGAIVIAGHISGGGMQGAMYKVNMLGVGDNVQVRTKDGQVFNYKVYKTKTYDHDSFIMDEILKSAIPSREGLNILTFTDKFDVRVRRFEQRLVVFAVKE